MEEIECRRAHEMAVENCLRMFDKSTAPDEVRIVSDREVLRHERQATIGFQTLRQTCFMIQIWRMFSDAPSAFHLDPECFARCA